VTTGQTGSGILQLGYDYLCRVPSQFGSGDPVPPVGKIPMTMEDWAKRLDLFLEFDDRKVLQDSGKVTTQLAKAHAESEFEKYRIVQDRLFESDFDRENKILEQEKDKK